MGKKLYLKKMTDRERESDELEGEKRGEIK